MKKQIVFLILALVVCRAQSWAQAPFYQGKTITVVAAASAGSAYDLYARLMAQFMGKHIPGNPSFIVQNMTGAGSIIGTNYLYNVSKPDGLTIGAIQPSIYFNQLMKQNEVKYDWAKLTWIGSSDKSDYLLYMRADLPYKTLADVRKAKEPPKCGSTGAGTSGSYMPKLLEEVLGTKFTIVAGYQGGGDDRDGFALIKWALSPCGAGFQCQGEKDYQNNHQLSVISSSYSAAIIGPFGRRLNLAELFRRVS